MNKKFLLIFVLFLVKKASIAQTISLEEACVMATNNNFNIQAAQNNAHIAKANNFLGNTGKLPRINLVINDNYQIFGINQVLASGQEINRNGATSNALNATLRADWQLFNGFRIPATQERLILQEINGQLALKAQKQMIIASVIIAYTDIVRQKQNLKVLKSSLDVSEKRMEIIKKRMEAGTANQTDLYLAELDINTQKQALANQYLGIKQATVNLNLLIGKRAEENTEVSENISFEENISIEELRNALQNNPQLEIVKNNLKIGKNLEKESNAQRLPTFNLNAGYSYNRNNSTAGFLLLNQNYGAFVGFNFTLPLYNGSVNSRQFEIAKLQTKTQEIELQRLKQELDGELERQWQAYLLAKEQLQAEEKNAKVAQEYLVLMQKRFELGQSNIIEIREAQRVLESTEGRRSQAIFNLKVAETQVLLVAGKLSGY
jgi:outer membrane protein TolC